MNEANVFEDTAQKCERVNAELERAAAHMHTTAGHFRSKNVPRAGAYTLSTYRHLENAQALLTDIARQHAARLTP